MAKNNIDLSVVLHNTSDYKDWLVELKERFYSHRLKASCATNGYLLDFYWKLGRDIEAKQYTNTYGSGFYKNLSQDLKNEMPGVKGFSPTNLKYMSYFYKLYAPLQANCPQLADNFIEDLYIADIQRVVAQSKNRPQFADDFKLLFLIPWVHHRRIIDKCKDDMDKALFFARKTWENNSFYRSRFPQRLFFPILRKSHSNNINIWIFFQQNIYLIAESIRWIDNVQEILNHTKNKIYVLSSFSWQCNKRKSRPPWHHWGYTKRLVP